MNVFATIKLKTSSTHCKKLCLPSRTKTRKWSPYCTTFYSLSRLGLHTVIHVALLSNIDIINRRTLTFNIIWRVINGVINANITLILIIIIIVLIIYTITIPTVLFFLFRNHIL